MFVLAMIRYFFKICVLLIFAYCEIAKGQAPYNTALGLRLNQGIGITARHTINDDQSVEGILYYRRHGVNATGLFQINYPVLKESSIRFYTGAGAHIGVWNGYYYTESVKHKSDVYLVAGVDGQAGVEYTFTKIPLNFSIDWKPSFNFIEVTHFWADDVALSVRWKIK